MYSHSQYGARTRTYYGHPRVVYIIHATMVLESDLASTSAINILTRIGVNLSVCLSVTDVTSLPQRVLWERDYKSIL